MAGRAEQSRHHEHVQQALTQHAAAQDKPKAMASEGWHPCTLLD